MIWNHRKAIYNLQKFFGFRENFLTHNKENIYLKNLNQEMPYQLFNEKYYEAVDAEQTSIEAISISSYNKEIGEVDSRYVNLKFITNDVCIIF